MSRILVIGSGMPPYENANGICTQSVIIDMCNRGHTVYYLDWMANGLSVSKESEHLYICGRAVSDREPNDPDTQGEVCKKRIRKIWLEGILFPFSSIGRTKYLCKTAKYICAEFQVEKVVAVYQPFITLFAGLYVKKVFPQITFIPYYLDLISNPYIDLPGVSINRQRKVMKWWEARVNEASDYVIYMDSSREYHKKVNSEKMWYNKIRYLDIPLFNPNKKRMDPNTETKKEIEIVFSGYLGEHRNIAYFLKVLERLPEYIHLVIAGNVSNSNAASIERFQREYPGRVECVGYISHEDLGSLFQKADCFLNLGVRSCTAIAAKIYEYMSFGKPIIMTFSVDDEPSRAVLKKYPNTFFLDERVEISERTVQALDDFLENGNRECADLNSLSEVLYKNTPQAFTDLIELCT